MSRAIQKERKKVSKKPKRRNHPKTKKKINQTRKIIFKILGDKKLYFEEGYINKKYLSENTKGFIEIRKHNKSNEKRRLVTRGNITSIKKINDYNSISYEIILDTKDQIMIEFMEDQKNI